MQAFRTIAGPKPHGLQSISEPRRRCTIKGGSRRAEKSRKVLMMMKAAKLGRAGSGAGQEQTMSRPGAGWEHARSRPGAMQEQGRSKSWAGALAVHIPNFIQIVLKT